MTDQFSPDHEARGGSQGGAPRAASVQLRQQDERTDHASLMDPANQSLAEALRITFRLLQGAMIVLGVLYILSGFQAIQTNERGIRLLFGDVVAQDLRPGFQFAPPYPIGELVKVDVGNRDIAIDRMYWPYVEPGREGQSIDQLRSTPALSPEQDGFLLTGDGAIAHTQWRVQYTRGDATEYARSVYPPHETGLVRAAAMRGIVQAVAQVEIDALLKQGATEEGSVSLLAKSIAQDTLEAIGVRGTGLAIEQLALEQKIPPAYLRDAFNSVQQATSRASAAVETAQREAATILSNTAGGAAPYLIELIDEYERAIDAGETEAAEEALRAFNRLLDGEAVMVNGREVNAPIGGAVAERLAQADQYRATVVDRARSDLQNFRAKLVQFRSNPVVMVTSDWSDALGSFFSDERVEVFFNPPGMQTLEMLISRDPQIAAEAERRMRAEQTRTAREQREREMEEARFRTQEGLQTPGGR